MFVIAHELKHKEQHQNRKMVYSHDNIYFDGVKYDRFMLQYLEKNKYSEIPWEVDANEFAIKYITGKI